MSKSIKSKNKDKGNFGENIVNNYINKNGFKIIERNFRSHFGEIDIIFKDNEELVFCEIKTRTGTNYGFPAESVTDTKKKHILNTAKYFIYINNIKNSLIRFDVIEVFLLKNKISINHIKNVFW